jgi:hypothetical protein
LLAIKRLLLESGARNKTFYYFCVASKQMAAHHVHNEAFILFYQQQAADGEKYHTKNKPRAGVHSNAARPSAKKKKVTPPITDERPRIGL